MSAPEPFGTHRAWEWDGVFHDFGIYGWFLVLSAEINDVSIGYTKNYLGSMDLFVLKLIQFYQNHIYIYILIDIFIFIT